MPSPITPPTIEGSQVVFGENEARTIFGFFWPGSRERIQQTEMTLSRRRFAQSLLIAAIDASYAMGYVEGLFQAVTKSSKGLKSFGQRLARNYFRHWWRHATRTDLEDVRIYESVRASVARNFATEFELMLNGEYASRPLAPFYVAGSGTSRAWG